MGATKIRIVVLADGITAEVIELNPDAKRRRLENTELNAARAKAKADKAAAKREAEELAKAERKEKKRFETMSKTMTIVSEIHQMRKEMKDVLATFERDVMAEHVPMFQSAWRTRERTVTSATCLSSRGIVPSVVCRWVFRPIFVG
jgi:protein subunit release factor B